MTAIPFDAVRAWMFDHALPLWGEAGIDRARGGFYEELDLSGAPTAVAFKRTRAMWRQVYVFSHAALLGWAPGAALSAYGYEYLVRTSWQGEERGWAKRLSADGAVIDPTPDLYDQAFALFGLAWRYRLSRDGDVLARAHATLDFIETRMREPGGAGFWHTLPPEGPRVQNPHMHLLEACLAAYEATQGARFRAVAEEVVRLFRAHFFDGRTLGEFFDAQWRRLPDAQGRIVEPGHHFEWAWILAQYERLFGGDLRAEARALVAFAERYGVDPAGGAVFNQVRDDGAPLDDSSRTWPNTERIKGQIAMFEWGEAGALAPIAQSARLLLDRYCAVSPRGLWVDHFDRAGAPKSGPAPASTFYHAFLAFAEILRLEARITTP